MAKKKQVYFCQQCGMESSKWMGQCPGCKEWNTFVEEIVEVKKNSSHRANRLTKAKPVTLEEVSTEQEDRISTSIEEFDRVLGGGIVQGSLILVGGDPGIGKSTLLLQMCLELSQNKYSVLYVSGEESLQQIKIRADRLNSEVRSLQLLCETDMDSIEQILREVKPKVAIIDSIQTMVVEDVQSAAGSVSQVREVTNRLMRLAKEENIAIFIVGHVTKEGTVAGPRTLEHMVDTVLYFEGDKQAIYRVLRGVKNRFGSTNEIGVFEMKQDGLEQVKNPSKVLLEGRPENASGSVVVCSIEGTRPLLTEIQALVSETNFNLPRRTAVGLDYNRVNLLMAVLEKRAGLRMAGCDAYVNIAGGIKINEPAMDLGIIMAIASSYKNKEINPNVAIFGEVGLSGEIRSVNMAEQRVNEIEKMGFEICILPESNRIHIKKSKLRLIGVKNITEALDQI